MLFHDGRFACMLSILLFLPDCMFTSFSYADDLPPVLMPLFHKHVMHARSDDEMTCVNCS
jgi:hypothetical protein